MTVSLSELGSNAIEQYQGEVHEEWRTDLQGSSAMKKYREMIDESPVLGGWYTIFEFLLRQANLRVDAGREAASAKAERERIDESFKDMKTPTDVLIGEIASGGPFGFGVWEKVFKIRRGPGETDTSLRSKYEDGRIGWYDLAFRPQDSLSRWDFDAKSEWSAFVQCSPPTYEEVAIPREKLVHLVLRPWKRSPEGRSMLRSSVDAYEKARGHAERESIAGFKNAAGMFYMQTPIETWDQSDTPEAQEARAIKRQVVKDLGKLTLTEYAAMAIPPEEDRDGVKTGWKLGQVEGAKVLFPYDTVIKRWESRELLPVLCDHLLFGHNDHGSFAMKDRSTDLFALALGAILKRACAVLTEAAAELSTMNGVPAEDHAVVAYDDIETPELTQMANFVAQVLGVDPTQLNDVIRRYLEQYAKLPAGSLGVQQEMVDAKPEPTPPPVPGPSTTAPGPGQNEEEKAPEGEADDASEEG